VLRHNIIHQFENTSHKFLIETEDAIKIFGLKNEIIYTLNKSSSEGNEVKGPCVLNSEKQINIQETFLAYLWCMCYSLHINVDNLISSARTDNNQLKDTQAIFSYALSLKDRYSDWDKKNLPNPECYSDQDKDDIERTNELFLYALNFILCHEFSHIALGHVTLENTSTEQKKEFEIEADSKSIELLKEGIFKNNDKAVTYGVSLALCSLIFFKNSVARVIHPDSDTRIQTALELLEVDKNDTSWLIACSSLDLWARHFNIQISMEEKPSFKELFDYMAKQLE